MVSVQPRRASPNMWWFTAQVTSSHGRLQVKQRILPALGSKLWNKAKLRDHVHVSFSLVNIDLRAWFTGVSLTDDEADNTQGSRYCLVAIGRLQVCVWKRLQNILFLTSYVSKFVRDTWWTGHRGVGEPHLEHLDSGPGGLGLSPSAPTTCRGWVCCKSGNSRKLSWVLAAQTSSREVERMLCSSVISAMKLSSQVVEAKCFLLRTYIYVEIVFCRQNSLVSGVDHA